MPLLAIAVLAMGGQGGGVLAEDLAARRGAELAQVVRARRVFNRILLLEIVEIAGLFQHSR